MMVTTVLAVVACVLAILGVICGVLALRTLARLRSSVRLLSRTAGRDSLLEVTAHHVELAAGADRTVGELRTLVEARLADTDARTAAAVSELGVRFEEALAADRGDVDVRVEQGRERLAAEVASLQEQLGAGRAELLAELAQGRAALVAELAEQRTAAGADQDSAHELVRSTLGGVDGIVNASLRRVALVRFDAYDDLSGRLSFALALLDGHGDGIVLTSMAGRADTRLYAKPIAAGTAEVDLAPEERKALKAALAIK